MNLDHDLFQVCKLSENKKKVFTKNGTLFPPKKVFTKMEHFFPQIQVKTKKKVLHQMWNIFYPKFQAKKGLYQKFSRFEVETCAHMHTRVKLLERMQMKTIIKLLGGIQSNFPGFRHPWTIVVLRKME